MVRAGSTPRGTWATPIRTAPIGWGYGSADSFSTAEHGLASMEVLVNRSPSTHPRRRRDHPGPRADGWTRLTSSGIRHGTQVVITSDHRAGAGLRGLLRSGTASGFGTFDAVDMKRYDQLLAARSVYDNVVAIPRRSSRTAASHQAVHFGLHYYGTRTASHHGPRPGSCVTGSSATRAVSQFSQGEYTGASNTRTTSRVLPGQRPAHTAPTTTDR